MPIDHSQGGARAYKIIESLLKRFSIMVMGKHTEQSSEARNHGARARYIIVRHPFERLYCAHIDDGT